MPSSEPILLGAETDLLEEACRKFGRALCGAETPSTEQLRQWLSARRDPIFLCLRNEGRVVTRGWFSEPNQWAGLQVGFAELARELPRDVPLEQLTVELSLSSDFTTVDVASDQQWRSLNADRFRGVLGFEFRRDSIVERIAPLQAIVSNGNAERLLQHFVEQHGIAFDEVRGGISIRRFRAAEALIAFGPEPVVHVLRRGARWVRPEEIDAGHVRELADLLCGYLRRSVEPDGRMRYLYHPSRSEEVTSQNNMIRQWMATWALCRAAKASKDDDLGELVERNIRYNLAHFYREENGLGLIEYDGRVKLGAVALAVLAIREHALRGNHRQVEASLWRTIDHAWQPTGEFRTFYRPSDRNDQQNYYPGEALLAWSLRYEETREAPLLERFLKSFRYYRKWHRQPEHQNSAFIPWHTQAYYRIFQHTGDRELADFIFEMSDWLLPMQQWPVSAAPECAGRFYDTSGRFGPPHASSTGVYLEGLADAYSLARSLGDRERAERYRRAICRGIRSVSQLVYRDRSDLYYVKDPGLVRGGVRTTCYDNVIRVDNVQHNLLALMKVLAAFSPDEFSCESLPLVPNAADSDGKRGDVLARESALEILDLATVRGANAWAPRTACTLEFHLASDPALESGWVERLRGFLAAADGAQRPNFEVAGGSGAGVTAIGRAIQATSLALLCEVDCPDEVGGTALVAPPNEPGSSGPNASHAGDRGLVWVSAEFPEVSARALELGARIVAAAVAAKSDAMLRSLHDDRESFGQYCKDFLPGPERREILRAAIRRGIPWERVGRQPDIFRLGDGAAQEWCDLTTTSRTSRVHAQFTSNKPLANRLYRSLGVPVARQRLATNGAAAVTAAFELGFPVVTKPWRGSGGRGVSANLKDASQVERGYARAAKVFGPRVAVEQYLPGEDYRFLFIGGHFVAAAKRIPPHVVGDGTRSVRELVHAVNLERQRGRRLARTLKVYKLDDESTRVLAQQGHHRDSVPGKGEVVKLGSVANGGTTHDVTSEVHPDNIETARRAARIAGIDVCGVDFLLPDPRRSVFETGGGICEVNYQPSLMLHMICDGDIGTEVVDRFVEWLVPAGRSGRIPVALLPGAAPHLLARVASLLAPRTVARVDGASVYVGNQPVQNQRPSWSDAVRMALVDPGTEYLLLVPSEGELRQQGLGVEYCDVLVQAQPTSQSTLVHVVGARLATTHVRWVSGSFGDVEAPAREANATILCALDASDRALALHLEGRGRAVFVSGAGEIVCQGDSRVVLPLPKGALGNLVRDVVLAVATAWSLGANPAELDISAAVTISSGGAE